MNKKPTKVYAREMTPKYAQKLLRAVREHGSLRATAAVLGMAPTTLFEHLKRIEAMRSEAGLPRAERKPVVAPPVPARPVVPDTPTPSLPIDIAATGKPRYRVKTLSDAWVDTIPDKVAALLRRRKHTVAEMSAALLLTEARIRDGVDRLKAAGYRVLSTGSGSYAIETEHQPAAYLAGAAYRFTTLADNTLTFGACGDQHMGSKYERLDVVERYYDEFREAGAKVVFNTGNWIDGEARFNKHDLKVIGVDRQVRYLAEHYPQREGLTTYAVWGDDHEGWYAQREGIDMGRFAEKAFHDAGRTDWVNIGFMEAFVEVVNANTGKIARIAVVHPGGGSAYALSYSIQKIIESLDGGEKPDIALYGHYHKMWAGNIRNVWCFQTGCAEDQTPFMRKKRLEAHVGAYLCKLTQDPATGAIVRCSGDPLRYFNSGYYQKRWSYSDDVTKSDRVLGGR